MTNMLAVSHKCVFKKEKYLNLNFEVNFPSKKSVLGSMLIKLGM